MNSVYYCEKVLQKGLLPDNRRQSGAYYIFQQDGAPAQRSRHTVTFLTENVPEFIKPDNWPPNSQDLNLVDFSIWGYLQQLVYQQKIRNIQHLKDVIIDCWSEIS